MDPKSYCDVVGVELSSWKARIYDIIRKTEALSAGDRANLSSSLNELHELVDDLTERIEWLSRECPADWGGAKEQIEDTLAQMKNSWKNVWGVLGEKEYGIGGA